MQTEVSREPSRRGATKRVKERTYYIMYIKTDPQGGLFYKFKGAVKSIDPPKEEVHLHENKWGDRWEEYIDVYESKAEMRDMIALMIKEGGKEL